MNNSSAYSWYNNDPGNKNTYGALYNWWVVETGKLCPIGWSVSSMDNWTNLDTYLSLNSGGKIKEIGTVHWQTPNTGATNETGFTALPGGYRDAAGTGYNAGTGTGAFLYIGKDGFWWTKSYSYASTNNNKIIMLSFDGGGLLLTPVEKGYGLSVRCTKN